jgi:hypothetical protein
LNKKLVLTAALAAGLSAAAIFPIPASAHNAGHIILPSGDCQNVGGNNSVSLPDSAAAYTNRDGDLDLIPGTPGDEIGARFAAEQGNSAVLPRSCQ